MSTPLSRLVTRVAYGASQLPRVAWYVGHSLALRQLSEATRRQEGKKARHRPRTNLPVPDRNQIYGDMAALFAGFANVGGSLPSVDRDGSLPTYCTALGFLRGPLIFTGWKRAKTVLTEARGKRPRYTTEFHFSQAAG
jgi:hypothetical protein